MAVHDLAKALAIQELETAKYLVHSLSKGGLGELRDRFPESYIRILTGAHERLAIAEYVLQLIEKKEDGEG